MGSTPASATTLFIHIAVFAFVTFLIYLACMAMVRIEDKRQAQRQRRS